MQCLKSAVGISARIHHCHSPPPFTNSERPDLNGPFKFLFCASRLQGIDYGLGWMIREHHGQRLIEHGGNVGGYASKVAFLPDADLGRRIHAIVEAEGLDAQALLSHLAETIARHKIPRSIEFVTTPLRDDAGKLRRAQLSAERS